MGGGDVNTQMKGSVDDLREIKAKTEKKRAKRGMDKRRWSGESGGWRKPSSYDTIDFLSEA